MKKRFSSAILMLAALLGLSLLLYPTVSNWWNSFHQSRAIVHYTEETSGMDEQVKAKMLQEAQSYNQQLASKAPHWRFSEAERAEYNDILDVTGTGIMGYVEIPQIDCSLPIYHGTEEAVLSAGIGHFEGSSLPVGGESTHSVLSGHGGLPSAELLSNLDRLKEGDVFYLHVLDETLAYEVDHIISVEPDDLRELEIIEQEDLCTLITCTPYGINTHRLLVRGHRVPVVDDPVNKTMQEMESPESLAFTMILKISAVVLLLILIILIAWLKNKKKKNESVKDDL